MVGPAQLVIVLGPPFIIPSNRVCYSISLTSPCLSVTENLFGLLIDILQRHHGS